MWDLDEIRVKGGDVKNKVFRSFLEVRALKGVRYRFFKRRNISTIVLLLILALAVIIYGRYTNFQLVKNLNPQVDSLHLKITRENPEVMDAILYVSIFNFFPFDIEVDSFSYRLAVEDSVVLYNNQNEGRTVISNERHQGVLPLNFNFTRLSQMLEESSRKEGAKGAKLDIFAYVRLPVIGQQRFHFGQAQHITISKAPNLALKSLDVVVDGEESKSMEIDFYLDVERNLPQGSLIDSIEYTVFIEDTPYIYGRKQRNIPLYNVGDRGVLLSAEVLFTDLQQQIKRLQGTDSMWMTMSGYAGLIFPYGQYFNVRWDVEKKILVPHPPTITIVAMDLQKFDIDTSELVVQLNVLNDNAFGLTFHEISYDFYIGRKLLASNTINTEQRVDAKSESNLLIPVSLQSMRTGWQAMKMKVFGTEPKYTMIAKFKITSDIKEIGDIELNLTGRGRIKQPDEDNNSSINLKDILRELE